MTSQRTEEMSQNFFFYKVWIEIGEIKDSLFEPNFFIGTLQKFEKWTLDIKEKDFSLLLQWYELKKEEKDGYYQILVDNIPAWIGKIKNNKLKSLIPTKFIRK
jgi:hypothetical protein